MDKDRTERLWRDTSALSYVRVGGTDEETRAAGQIEALLGETGARVWQEPFEIPFFEIDRAALCAGEEIPCTAVRFSGTTGEEGICAPFACVGDAKPEELEDARGKIVLCQELLTLERWRNLLEAGVAGVITLTGAVIDDANLVRMAPSLVKEAHRRAGHIPAVQISARDAVRLAQRKPETVTLWLQARTVKRLSRNVVCELPGAARPDEMIVFTAHYDSVANSRGACDNAAGSAALLETARYFAAHAPQRTMRFVFTGSEERGLLGSRAYVEAHEDELERMVLEVNVDMGGATLGTNKIFVTADDGLRCLARAMADETGYLCDVTQDTYSSDSIPFADSGVPAINFARIATPGTLTVHNWQDSLEWMSPEPLAEMTDFLIAFVARLAGAKRFPVEQEIPDNVREKIAAYLKRKPY